MTDTTFAIPDYVTRTDHRTIGDLAVITTDLLAEAAASGLPLPRSITMAFDELRMQLGGLPDIWDAMAAWADRYGHREDITIRAADFDDGPHVHVTYTFHRQGVNVELYAYFKPTKEGTTPS